MSSLANLTAQAQMFGDTNIGARESFSGNERYLRGNRTRRDFVGAARAEQTGFVGAQQALGVGRVPAATEGLRIDATDPARINRPLPQQPINGLYYPRLVVDLRDSMVERIPAVGPEEESAQWRPPRAQLAETRLRQRVERLGGPAVELAKAETTVVLRGQVDSQRTAELLLQILAFEPGVDRVQNELQIDPSE